MLSVGASGAILGLVGAQLAEVRHVMSRDVMRSSAWSGAILGLVGAPLAEVRRGRARGPDSDRL